MSAETDVASSVATKSDPYVAYRPVKNQLSVWFLIASLVALVSGTTYFWVRVYASPLVNRQDVGSAVVFTLIFVALVKATHGMFVLEFSEYWRRNVRGYRRIYELTADNQQHTHIVNRRGQVENTTAGFDVCGHYQTAIQGSVISLSLSGWFQPKPHYIGPGGGDGGWTIKRAWKDLIIDPTEIILVDHYGIGIPVDIEQALQFLAYGSFSALSWRSMAPWLFKEFLKLENKNIDLARELQAYEQFLPELVHDIGTTKRFIKSDQAKDIVQKIKFFQATTPKAGWRNKIADTRVDLEQVRSPEVS